MEQGRIKLSRRAFIALFFATERTQPGAVYMGLVVDLLERMGEAPPRWKSFRRRRDISKRFEKDGSLSRPSAAYSESRPQQRPDAQEEGFTWCTWQGGVR